MNARGPRLRKILIIGIGAGDPEYLTVQALKALQAVDVFFLTEKGRDKEELSNFRREICRRYAPSRSYRIVEIQDPERDRTAADYPLAVASWHARRSAVYERSFIEQLSEGECGAFLVWGDPSLYDSLIRIVERIAERGTVAFDYEVIPGISSVQALAARHRIPLNAIGESIEITTGRQLAKQAILSASTVVVLLDGECAFRNVKDDVDIYWAAYLGSKDEILLSGKLKDIGAAIERVRAEARARKGWIMDTYLLRKRSPG